MARPVSSPFHLSPQSAVALLRPIAATLVELEARLAQYEERIPMPDSDREKIAVARGLIAHDLRRIAELADTRGPATATS